jgi:hypothetical protein
MMSHYAVPQANGACALLRIDGEHAAEEAWIPITAEHYATLSNSPRGIRIANGIPQANPPKAIRVIPRGVFMDRFTMATQLALEEMGEQSTTAGRMVRIFLRRLEAESMIRLDAPAVRGPLTQIAAALRAANVPGWTTQAEVDASLAAITADG